MPEEHPSTSFYLSIVEALIVANILISIGVDVGVNIVASVFCVKGQVEIFFVKVFVAVGESFAGDDVRFEFVAVEKVGSVDVDVNVVVNDLEGLWSGFATRPAGKRTNNFVLLHVVTLLKQVQTIH